MNGRISALVWLFVSLTIAAASMAQETPPVAARVSDQAIAVAEVQRMLDGVFHDKKTATADLPPAVKAQALEEIVKQRLVVAHARRAGEFPSAQDLAKAEKRWQIRLAAQGRKADAVTPAELHQQVVWQLVWDRYLAKYCTDERREKWFKNHHADVDGTELIVSHILLPVAGAGPKRFDELEKQAEAIRAEISSGKLDFAVAAEKFSGGPSAKQGGRLGKIGRRGPMVESFSRAAFQLQPGEISQPVRSPFGVHLIRCDGVVPGKKTIADLTGPIDDALAKELLEKLSRMERGKTAVEYTSAWPHFKPGTTELAK
jgi:parvulin-like peptidyl-prolyl isomerase